MPILEHEARTLVVSGTPPLNDFADINTIAPFLGAHLVVDDDDEIQSQNKRLKVIWKNRSKAEAFQAFKVPHSEAWHRRRHEVAQQNDEYVAKEGPFVGLGLPYESPRANAGYIFREILGTILVTHPHIDHLSGLAINTPMLQGGNGPKYL